MKKRLLNLILVFVLCISLFGAFTITASANSDIHAGGHLVWFSDSTMYKLIIRCNNVDYDVPIYISEYYGGITFVVDADDVPDGSQPTLTIGSYINQTFEKKMDFSMMWTQDGWGAQKEYYFYTFEFVDGGSMSLCGLPMSSLYEIKEKLEEDLSTLYYLEDVEVDAWTDAVDFFSVEFEKPPETVIPPYVPEHWYEILVVWVYDLFDAIGAIFSGVFRLVAVDLSAVGDFFDALFDSEIGVFGWLKDTAFLSQIVLFFGFVGDCFSALPTPILYLLRFGVGTGLGIALLKIISK